MGALCLGFVGLAQGNWSGPEKNKNIIGSGEFVGDYFAINYIKYQDEDCYRFQVKIKGNQQSIVEFSFHGDLGNKIVICDDKVVIRDDKQIYLDFIPVLGRECKACKQNATSIVDRIKALSLTDKRISGIKVVEQDAFFSSESAGDKFFQNVKESFDKDFKQVQNDVSKGFKDCGFKESGSSVRLVDLTCSEDYASKLFIVRPEGEDGGKAIRVRYNRPISQYKIDVYEGNPTKKQTISFTYEGKFNDVIETVGYGLRADEEYRGFPSPCDRLLNCQTSAESVLIALKRAGIVERNKSFEFEPGILRNAWYVLTSKLVTIPVVAVCVCAGLVALCAAFDGE